MPVDVGSAVGYLDLDISGFLKNLKIAQNEAAKRSENISEVVGSKLESAGKSITKAGAKISLGITAPIVGAGFEITKMASSFEAGMSKVKAVSGASTDELKLLTAKAKELGATTEFSASQVAEGMSEMAKAGWNATQIIDGMGGVLNAASASGEDLAVVSTIVADAITGFGLSATDAVKVADLLTQAANAGTIDINDLGESFKYIAPIASTMGLSIEEVTTALAAMSKAGIKGSQGGTSLRTALVRMVKPTDDVAIVMKKLGFVLTNSDGSFKSLNEIVSMMRGKFSAMTDEQKTYYATILAGQEGMSGLLALLNLTEEEYDELTKSMKESSGVAEKTANIMLDNLNGQITILKSSLEGLAIQIGDIILPVIKKFTAKIQEWTEKFSKLSESQKKFVVAAAIFAASIGPILLVVGQMVSSLGSLFTVLGKLPGVLKALPGTLAKIAHPMTIFKDSLGAVKTGIIGLSKHIPMLSSLLTAPAAALGPILAVIAAIGLLIATFKTLWKNNEDFRNGIIEIWTSIKNTVQDFCDGIVERINSLGFNFEGITDVIKSIWNGFCNFLAPVFTKAFNSIRITVETVLDGILAVVDIFISLFKGDWEGLWQGVKDFFLAIWHGIRDIFLNAIGVTREEFVNFFKNILDNVIEWKDNMIAKAKEMAKNFVNSITEFFDNLPYKIGFALGSAYAHVKQWGIDTWNKAIETGKNFLDATETFFKELPGKVKEYFDKTIDNAVKSGKEFVDKTVESAKEFPGKVKGMFDKAVAEAKAWGPKMKQKIVDGFNQMIEEAKNRAKEIKDSFMETGKNIVSGIWEGIKAKGRELRDNWKNFIKGLVDGANEELDIHSPSGVFARKTGRWIPPGISKGFVAAMPEAIKTMKKSLRKGTDEISNEEIDIGVSPVFSLLDNFKTFCSEIIIGLDSVENRIEESIKNMTILLSMLFDTRDGLMIPDDYSYALSNVYMDKTKKSIQSDRERSDDKNKNGNGGDTYNFYNTKPNPYEYARQMKKAKEELLDK